ncbi:uncharacterized protein LOC103386959 isoform X2 [Cynoglossus semilaevis]|uniref:uncharacterized protein LOC103386959 isoform X2 n=1 Tax=Cynoglossus semilaevis TaxID=244447 RepID=UPI0004970BE1|nr:uncharacterized protein LOC103386959 isoform X2 [Cynoglossus semilaevis]
MEGPCNKIYKIQYGDKFKKCSLKGLRVEGSTKALKANRTEADMGIEFASVTPTELPGATDIADAFVKGLSDPNVTFSLTVDAQTVEVTETPNDPATTTAAPLISNTVATTVAPTSRLISFKSVKDTFTTDLYDSQSTAFKQRASMIKNELESPMKKKLSSFVSLEAIAFRNGSVINLIKFYFTSSSVPTGNEIASALINAAASVTGFDIDTGSITVDGIPSSGTRQKISLISASFLVLLSWVLSNQQ